MKSDEFRHNGLIEFHPDDKERRYSMPDPDDEGLIESMRRLRFDLSSATMVDVYRVLAAADAYRHFAAHVAPTSSLVRQLRELRRSVREARKNRAV